MKRLLASVSLVAVTTTAALSAPEAKPTSKPAPVAAHVKAPPIHVAPADEYFGKLKMSVLGIRNTIKDVGANLDIDQARWTTLASKAAFAEDAVHDWEKKYPQDTWLAKTLFALERMYNKLDSDDGRKHAIAAMKWLVHDFPATWYGRTGKKELALGKVGHPVDTASNASPIPAVGGATAPASYTVDQTSSGTPAPATNATTSAGNANPAGSNPGSPAGPGSTMNASTAPNGVTASPVPAPTISNDPNSHAPR